MTHRDRSWLWLYISLAVLVFGGATFVGSNDWTPASVWQSFLSEDQTVFGNWRQFRFKRVLFAGAVGALLSLSGLIFQAVLRNPLAEPYILGVSGGASLATVLASLLGVDLLASALGASMHVLVAFAGALGSVVLLYSLSRSGDLRDTASLILCGVVLNAVFLAAILVVLSLSTELEVATYTRWLIGDFSNLTFVENSTLIRNALGVVIGSVLFLAVARHLDLLSLSDDEAADLGLRPHRFRWFALIVASILTGIAVAGVGPIGFVGLIVPHIVKLLHGPSHARNIPLVVFAGAIFLIVADAAARVANPVPVGAITALCGGPFFFVLLIRGRREVRI